MFLLDFQSTIFFFHLQHRSWKWYYTLIVVQITGQRLSSLKNPIRSAKRIFQVPFTVTLKLITAWVRSVSLVNDLCFFNDANHWIARCTGRKALQPASSIHLYTSRSGHYMIQRWTLQQKVTNPFAQKIQPGACSEATQNSNGTAPTGVPHLKWYI